MTTQPTAPPCPTPQTLLRFAEGRLPQKEIAPVLQHLDTCEDCMAAVELANEVVAGTGERAVREHRGRWAIGLAAAAAAGAIVFFMTREPAQDGMARLIALVPRSERLVEPRLSAAFPWAEYRGPARAGATPDAERMKLIGAAGEAAERASRDSSAEAQHVAGVAMLLVDQPVAGEHALQIAAERAPGEATVWSDLAAARYVAALRLGRPSMYPEALAAADAALRIDPGLAVAVFNRALILERLALRDQARAAWQRYLELDSSSPWATEARAHLAALPASDAGSRFRRDLETLERAAEAGDMARVRAIVAVHPQQCRSRGEGDYLGRWGQAELRGDRAAAQRLLTIARAIGEALAATNGERLLRDSVAAIDGGSGRAVLAEAYAQYFEGRTLYARQQPSAAGGHLRRAAAGFARANSPMALVARYFAANTDVDRQLIPRARAELTALLVMVPRGHDALAAQIRWELGLCSMFDGNWPEALAHLRESEAFFARARELGNLASVQSLLATTLTAMGRADEAWASRIAAFETLQAEGNRERLLVAVGGAARMELRAMRRPRSALALMGIEESLCRAQNSAAYTSETLVRQAILSSELGDHGSADRLVAAADAESARVDDPRLRGRLEADVRFARGAVLLRTDPARAHDDLSYALDAYLARHYTVLLPEAYLLRSRASWRRGDVEGAARDLDRGIEALERHPIRQAGSVVGTGVLDAGRALYEDAIKLQLARNDRAAAFAYAERARPRLVAEVPSARIEQLQQQLAGSGTVVLALVTLPDELVAFSVTADALRAARSPVGRARLEQLAASGAMHELYDLLIRPSEDALAGARTLIVVPDRALQNVAFAALADRKSRRRLVETMAVVTAPSAFVLRGERASSAPGALLAVSLPTGESAGSTALPDGEREVREIGGRYPAPQVLAAADATFAAFSRAVPRASVIHIAGHTERKSSAGTSFVFADGERVDSRTIAAMRVSRGAVVVLAGCETLRTTGPAYEPERTLGEAFLAAGARAVIGTLAPVADREARHFFASVHHQLAAGLGEAEALRRAQIEWLGRGTAWQSVTLLTTRIPMQ